ncbi:unnamed protein product [Gordionus sp. m RMFG-2023]
MYSSHHSNVFHHHTISFIQPNPISLPFVHYQCIPASYHSIHSTKSHLPITNVLLIPFQCIPASYYFIHSTKSHLSITNVLQHHTIPLIQIPSDSHSPIAFIIILKSPFDHYHYNSSSFLKSN